MPGGPPPPGEPRAPRRIRPINRLYCCAPGIAGLARLLGIHAKGMDSVYVVDAKAFVGDEENGDIRVGGGAMLHDLSFREPDEGSRAERPFMGDEPAFEDIQTVPARVRMMRIHDPGGIADQPDLGPGLRVGIQVLAEDHLPQFLVETFFPGLIKPVHREEFVRHVFSRRGSSFSNRPFGRQPALRDAASILTRPFGSSKAAASLGVSNGDRRDGKGVREAFPGGWSGALYLELRESCTPCTIS